jgi:predicted CXXCH cytochrome family protein
MEPELIPGDSASTAGGYEEPGMEALLVHFPYAERECAACHDPNSLGTLQEPQPDLCYMCHEDYSRSYTYLHGPVAGGYCTSCHHPHLSENAHLLRFTGSELCYYCHRKEGVLKNDMHTDLEGMDCCDCHNAHGGEDRYIFQ